MDLDNSLAVLAGASTPKSTSTSFPAGSAQKSAATAVTGAESGTGAAGAARHAAAYKTAAAAATAAAVSNHKGPVAALTSDVFEPQLPPDPLLSAAGTRRTTVGDLAGRFRRLCSRILPFGNVGELELQVLALTSTGYVQDDGQGTDIWLRKSRLAREFGLRWFLRLKNAHSELHRSLHTISKVALLCSYLDAFWTNDMDNDDATSAPGKKGCTTARNLRASQPRTAAEVIGTAQISRKDGVELAIWFQDVVCRPGDGDIVSKRDSADLFESFARNGGIPDAARVRVSRLIRRTAVFSSENNPARASGSGQASKRSSSNSGDSSEGWGSAESTGKKTSPSVSSPKKRQFEVDAAMLRSWNRIFLFGGTRRVHNDRANRLRLEYRHLPNTRWFKRRAGMLREFLGLRRFMEPAGGQIWLKPGELRDQVERCCRSNCKYELESLRHGEMPGAEELLETAGGPVRSLQDQPRYLDGGSGLAGQVVVTPLVSGVSRGGSLAARQEGKASLEGPCAMSSVSHCAVGPGSRTLRQMYGGRCVYYVVRGRGEVFRGGLVEDVQSDDYVEIFAHTAHYFVNRSATQDLALLVIAQNESTSTRLIIE